MYPSTALLALAILVTLPAGAGNENPDTDWLRDAKYGAFMHLLPGNDAQLKQVQDFDVPAVTRQLETMGAKYFVITLGQNSGFFIAPNATYDRATARQAGERCSVRDLPLDLHRALDPKGIRLMLYLPCQTPNADPVAQKAFGLPAGAKDQPIDLAFAEKWAAVIQEWSDRYGGRVSGWWFDGGYEHVGFNEAIAARYAAAVKHGNPGAIVTFNPGVKLVRHTRAEDYTAGELNEPLGVIPSGRWVEGSQWQALTFVGSMWGRRDGRYTDAQWVTWVQAVVAGGGAATFDLGPNWDPTAGPIGTFAEAQVRQLEAVKAAVR